MATGVGTARDLIATALREIGVLAQGEAATADDASLALTQLNQLIDGWATEQLRMHTVTRTVFTIVASTGSYTVGATGDVAITRPVVVNDVTFQDTATSPATQYQLEKFTEWGWANRRQPAETSNFPTHWYWNPTHPNATLHLWPTPTDANLEGVIYALAPVAQIAALSTVVDLPPGYERMIVKALALELSPSYEKQANPLLIAQARDAKEVVKRANKRLIDLRLDSAALIGNHEGGSYSIYEG